MSASMAQLIGHEARLGMRELLWMITAGRRLRAIRMLFGFVVFLGFLHWLSYAVLQHMIVPLGQDLPSLVTISASLWLAWMLMLSQAMETVTRGFYTRGDLDLILSSPVSYTRVFMLRVAVNAVVVSLMSTVLVGPAVNVLAATDSPRWLAGYGVAIAMGFSATAIAVAATVGLFHLVGPKRTRFVAQVMAAVVGAAFVIGLQVAAILQMGEISRLSLLRTPAMLAHMPEVKSLWWWPARAVTGDLSALTGLLLMVAIFYSAVTFPLVRRFAHYTTMASGAAQQSVQQNVRTDFRTWSPMQALRRKEWRLIARDHWLVSQSLMQLLYLAPPALLLWQDLHKGGQGLLVLVPLLVMAAGQLAGGVTWITISGEDAPDLIATAPLTARQALRAKLQAVMAVVGFVFAAFLVGLTLISPWVAAVTAVGIIVAAISTATIQLWFRTQARRSNFRRRHTASRIATFAEAFTCIAWAGAAALIAAKSMFAPALVLIALLVLGTARVLRPRRS